jgi:hypothetical protein
MNNTAWKYSIEYINSIKDDTPFDTRLMLKYVRKTKPNTQPNTMFWHRVILARLGFLVQLHKGCWRKIKDFPYDVGKAKAQDVAWSKLPWKQWFIPPGWPKLKTQKSEVANGRHGGNSSD